MMLLRRRGPDCLLPKWENDVWLLISADFGCAWRGHCLSALLSPTTSGLKWKSHLYWLELSRQGLGSARQTLDLLIRQSERSILPPEVDQLDFLHFIYRKGKYYHHLRPKS